MSQGKHADLVCPLSSVDRRLDDVHHHWHEAERGYFDPERFRIGIQATIQTLRTVTFILQSNKRLFENFDAWYTPWQDRFRSDALMRWMIDARNKIEKVGDLETHSQVRAEIIASYYEEGPRLEVPAELFQDPSSLLKSIASPALMQHVMANGVLRIQRRWVENTLPGYELLEATAIAFGKISELVHDAHRALGLEEPKTAINEVEAIGRRSRGGRLPCMIGHADLRHADFWIATGQRLDLERTDVEFDREHAMKVASRYGLEPKAVVASTSDAEGTLHSLFGTARKMFEVDGHHETIAFLLLGERPIKVVDLRVQNHGEKYVVMRSLANDVTKLGADGVIMVAEVWSAAFDPTNPYRRAVDATDKREFLTATLVTKVGEPRQLVAEIVRDGGQLSLGSTDRLDDEAQIAFAPIYEAWRKPIPQSWRTFADSAESGGKPDAAA